MHLSTLCFLIFLHCVDVPLVFGSSLARAWLEKRSFRQSQQPLQLALAGPGLQRFPGIVELACQTVLHEKRILEHRGILGLCTFDKYTNRSIKLVQYTIIWSSVYNYLHRMTQLHMCLFSRTYHETLSIRTFWQCGKVMDHPDRIWTCSQLVILGCDCQVVAACGMWQWLRELVSFDRMVTDWVPLI